MRLCTQRLRHQHFFNFLIVNHYKVRSEVRDALELVLAVIIMLQAERHELKKEA